MGAYVLGWLIGSILGFMCGYLFSQWRELKRERGE